MKNIVFLLDTLETGGAEKSLLEISSRFKGLKPVFIQLFPGDSLKVQFEKAGIMVHAMDLKPNYDFNQIAKTILPLLMKYQPEIIHTTLFRADMVGRALKMYHDFILINSLVNDSYSPHRYAQLSLTGQIKLKGIELWDRWTAKKVDYFVSNSQAIKKTNAQKLKVKEENIQVIYRGRNISKYQDNLSGNPKDLLPNIDLSGKNVFLNVGRLLDRKGQLDMINAFHLFLQNSPNNLLLIAGEGPYRKILENRIAELNLGSYVYLLGNRKDIAQLLQLSDYFVFPSYYEGLPGSLIEAILAKKPLVLSDIPENRECVTGQGGLFFEKGNIQQLALQMEKALEIDWEPIIEDNYNRAIEVFDIDKIAKAYEEFYHRLLKEKT